MKKFLREFHIELLAGLGGPILLALIYAIIYLWDGEAPNPGFHIGGLVGYLVGARIVRLYRESRLLNPDEIDKILKASKVQ